MQCCFLSCCWFFCNTKNPLAQFFALFVLLVIIVNQIKTVTHHYYVKYMIQAASAEEELLFIKVRAKLHAHMSSYSCAVLPWGRSCWCRSRACQRSSPDDRFDRRCTPRNSPSDRSWWAPGSGRPPAPGTPTLPPAYSLRDNNTILIHFPVILWHLYVHSMHTTVTLSTVHSMHTTITLGTVHSVHTTITLGTVHSVHTTVTLGTVHSMHTTITWSTVHSVHTTVTVSTVHSVHTTVIVSIVQCAYYCYCEYCAY